MIVVLPVVTTIAAEMTTGVRAGGITGVVTAEWNTGMTVVLITAGAKTGVVTVGVATEETIPGNPEYPDVHANLRV